MNLPNDETEYNKRSNSHVNQSKCVVDTGWINFLFFWCKHAPAIVQKIIATMFLTTFIEFMIHVSKIFYLKNERSGDSLPFWAQFNGRSMKSFLSIKSQAFPSCETAFFVTINIGSLLSLVSLINSQVLHLLYVHTLVPSSTFVTASERKYFPKIIPIFFRWNFMVFYLIFFGLIFELSMLISRPSDEMLKTVLSQS